MQPSPIKSLFLIAVGVTQDGEYVARVSSILDDKENVVVRSKISQLMKAVMQRVCKRAVHNRAFPPPPPSPIIRPNGKGDVRLIVPACN